PALLGDVRSGGGDVQQRAGGAPGTAARDLLADDLVFIDHRTHERSELGIRPHTIDCAVHVTDRDTGAMDSRQYGRRRIGRIAGDAADWDCRGYVDRSADLQRVDSDDVHASDDER